MSPSECRDCSIGESSTKQDLERPPVASVQDIHHEAIDAELEDGQFLVERLLRRQVRRARKRKTVRYLAKWKGYTEEEHTSEDAVNIYEGLIEEYESRSVSAS